MKKSTLEKTSKFLKTGRGDWAFYSTIIIAPLITAAFLSDAIVKDTPKETTPISQELAESYTKTLSEITEDLRILRRMDNAVESQASTEKLKQMDAEVQTGLAQVKEDFMSFRSEVLTDKDLKPIDYLNIAESYNAASAYESKHVYNALPENAGYLNEARMENTTGDTISKSMVDKDPLGSLLLLWALTTILTVGGALHGVMSCEIREEDERLSRKLAKKLDKMAGPKTH